MKKILIGAFLMLLSSGLAQKTEAQIRVGVHINIGDQPSWRLPAHDYVEYYYLPDIECYYYVPRHQFIYLSGGRWIFSASLPFRYRNYDLYAGPKIVVNRPHAYYYFDEDRRRYGKVKYFRYDQGKHRGSPGHHGHKHH
jgi:hypothetical protein